MPADNQLGTALGALFRQHKDIPAKIRFWALIDVRSSGCWDWLGTRVPGGYGYFYIKGKNIRVAKWAYEYLIGPVPEGLELDHTCRNNCCVNPWHLEPVTHIVNVQRGDAKKIVCNRGHLLEPPNLIKDGSGFRCRECNKLRCIIHSIKRRFDNARSF